MHTGGATASPPCTRACMALFLIVKDNAHLIEVAWTGLDPPGFALIADIDVKACALLLC